MSLNLRFTVSFIDIYICMHIYRECAIPLLEDIVKVIFIIPQYIYMHIYACIYKGIYISACVCLHIIMFLFDLFDSTLLTLGIPMGLSLEVLQMMDYLKVMFTQVGFAVLE